MGNGHSRQIYSNFSESLDLSKFTLIEQFFVEPLGEIHELSTNNSNDKLFLKIINIDKEVPAKEINSIHDKLDLKHPSLLKLHGYNFSHKTTSGKIQTEVMFYFEPPAKTLQDEIIERRHNQQIFPANELLHCFKTCVDGLAFLEENGCSYEFITSETIFFSFENQVRIINPALVDLINYSESLRTQNEKENLNSCELSKIMSLTEKSIQNSVITLGITFLSCALLEDEETIYHLYENFDEDKIHLLNEKLRNRYPVDFINILRHMLTQDESQRPRFTHLRDNLDKYTKSEGQDDQFPISPIYLESPDLNNFAETAPSKLFKSVYSSSIILNSYVSPRNPFTSSKLSQEHLVKEPEKGFFEKLFCGLCSSNADERTELALSARPYRRTEGKQMRIEENPDENARFHDHVLEEFSKEYSEPKRAKLSHLLPKKAQGENFQTSDSNRNVNVQNKPQFNDEQTITDSDKRNHHMNSKPSVSMRYMESNEAIKEDQYESSQNVSNSRENFSPLQIIHPNGNQAIKKSSLLTSPEKKGKKKLITFNGIENESVKENDSKFRDSSFSAFSHKNSNIKKSTYSVTSNIQNLNSKKKSALVKKIIAQYKRSAEGKSQYQNQSQVLGQPFDKSFSAVSKFESHEKPYKTPNKILITDYLGKTQEKPKRGAISSSRLMGVTDSQNFQTYRSDLIGNEMKPIRSVRQYNDNLGANQTSQSLSQIKPKSHINSNYSTPFRGSHPGRKSSMFVMNNECPNCNTPFMSINKSYQYSIPGDIANQEEREAVLLQNERGVFSQRESPDNKPNSDMRMSFNSTSYRKHQEFKNEPGYSLKVTPPLH